MNSFKKSLALIGVLLISALPAYAATIGVGETYTLSSGEAAKGNVYAAGGTVILSGPVQGDAVFVSGDATVSGAISGDVLFAAGSGEVLGDVGGDVRAAGGKITLSEKIGGDALVAGGSVSIVSGSRIEGDAVLAGGKVSLLGDVGGNVSIAGGQVFIDGKIVGNVTVYGSGEVRVGPNAVIGGDFSYRAPNEALIDPKAIIKGNTDFKLVAPVLTARDVRGFFAGLVGAAFAIRIIALTAAALFFVLSFRRMTGEIVRFSRDRFWKSVLIGFIILVAVPFASVIIFFTIFGSVVAIALFLAWLSLVLLGQVYAGVVFGTFVRTRILRKELPPVITWPFAVLGALGLAVASLVPYVGTFIYLLFFLVALGSLSELVYRKVIVSR